MGLALRPFLFSYIKNLFGKDSFNENAGLYMGMNFIFLIIISVWFVLVLIDKYKPSLTDEDALALTGEDTLFQADEETLTLMDDDSLFLTDDDISYLTEEETFPADEEDAMSLVNDDEQFINDEDTPDLTDDNENDVEDKTGIKNDPNVLFFKLFLLSMLISLFFGSETSARSYMYFNYTIIILIPNIFKITPLPRKEHIEIFMSVFFAAFFVWNTLMGNSFDIVPYNFFWQR